MEDEVCIKVEIVRPLPKEKVNEKTDVPGRGKTASIHQLHMFQASYVMM